MVIPNAIKYKAGLVLFNLCIFDNVGCLLTYMLVSTDYGGQYNISLWANYFSFYYFGKALQELEFGYYQFFDKARVEIFLFDYKLRLEIIFYRF